MSAGFRSSGVTVGISSVLIDVALDVDGAVAVVLAWVVVVVVVVVALELILLLDWLIDGPMLVADFVVVGAVVVWVARSTVLGLLDVIGVLGDGTNVSINFSIFSR